MAEFSSTRRLAGISFAHQPLPAPDTLPRMDIAVFVGFAASGPLHTPVVVEDAVSFSAIFGDDLLLATGSLPGLTVYACLAPTVRSFFSNGGRRCWVIRVADEEKAEYNYYPIPGLLVAQSRDGKLSPAYAWARSEGSWSDALRVSAFLSAQPVTAKVSLKSGTDLDIQMDHPEELRQGDMLRITFQDDVLLFPVCAVSPNYDGDPTRPARSITLSSTAATWFSKAHSGSPLPDIQEAHEVTPEGEIPLLLAPHATGQEDGMVTLSYLPDKNSARKAPAPGTVLKVRCDNNDQGWLTVRRIAMVTDGGSPPGEVVRILGDWLWSKTAAPEPLSTTDPEVEKLSFELSVRKEDETPIRLGGLGFAPDHTRYWGAAPTDRVLFREEQLPGYVQMIQDVSDPRFPLASNVLSETIYYPVGMPTTRDAVLLESFNMSAGAMARNGLEKISAAIFLDPAMMTSMVEILMATADYRRYQGPFPQRILRGIHAALNIEEASLIAVPDAVHCGWADDGSIPKALDHQEANPAESPATDSFLDCKTISPPLLEVGKEPDAAGTFTLSWLNGPADATYTLEESATPEFVGAVSVYIGALESFQVTGHAPGQCYYRIRIESRGLLSAWSNIVNVYVPLAGQIKKIFAQDDILAVHRSLIRLCAARGDLTASLSLPQHFRENDAISYVKVLKSSLVQSKTAEVVVPPLTNSEANAFSYTFLFHPWVISRRIEGKGEFVAIPPDGAICGMIARRSLSRGAWLAPANELLSGVVALTPPLLRESRLSFLEAQINLIRQEPRGFTTLSADTLCDDRDLRPINVRRLLILVRKQALKKGAEYVFEPNDAVFRRMVQRGFEAMLDDMFMRGAFSGATPATAYQVVAGSSLNSPLSMEQGRFIVELKVSPSNPMSFLTIRLLQTGDRMSVSEGH